jgi:hypothetical protein
MKTIGYIGAQLRRALNEARGFVDAEDISAAVWQASNAVFGHYAGHQGLLRPGQPLPAAGYGLNDPINTALNPFLQQQVYSLSPGSATVLPWASDGTILFPVALDAAGQPVLAGSFQRPTALLYPEAKRVKEVNENALAATLANSISAPTAKFPLRVPVPGGYKVLPVSSGVGALTLLYLAAPPRPVFAEMADPNDAFEMVYDDDKSVDIGWTDVTAINEIIAHATRLLGGQVKDQQAVGIATQTAQMGA